MGILSIIITLGIAYLTMVTGWLFVQKPMEGRHPAAVAGVAGLLGLGGLGLLTGLLGLLPGGVMIATGAGIFCLLLGLFLGVKQGRIGLRFFGRRPQGFEWLGFAAVGFTTLVGLINALAPSLISDWDTIAYHLAVPKIWMTDGQIHPITFIHHSNFPGSVDSLYLWGLQYGGQTGAKAFTLAFFLFGALAIFGFARERYGSSAACWATAAFATIPVLAWETGSGYIDVAHGLFAGLGAWVLLLGFESSRRGEMLVGAALLGFAAGSKYTGLQGLICIGLVLLALGISRKGTDWKGMGIAAALAVVVCAPWYLRNIAWTGNPVYPFFYEQFRGKHWTQLQADVYKNEQKSFGVQDGGLMRAGPAVLGLAYSPGRYINPDQRLRVENGQPLGANGDPKGATGPVVIAALLCGLAFWRRLTPKGMIAEAGVLSWVLLGLGMWFMLSQQSRYALSFAPPLCIVVGGLVTQIAVGRVLGALVVLQCLWTGYLAKEQLLGPERVRAALGATDTQTYLRGGLSFYEAAEYLNEQKAKRVALFDEVFGFYLDVPYFWASYGHTDEMGYETMKSSDEFVASLKGLGIDRLYVKLQPGDPEGTRRWLDAMGFSGTPTPLPEAEKAALVKDPQSCWRAYLVDAVVGGKIAFEKQTRGGLIFKLTD